MMNYGPDDFVIVEVSLRELEVCVPCPLIVLRIGGCPVQRAFKSVG